MITLEKTPLVPSALEGFLERLDTGVAIIGIIGLGYVGLPLAVEFSQRYNVIGFDVSDETVSGLNSGVSHIGDVPSASIAPLVQREALVATHDFLRLGECDAIIICVPTPLEKSLAPDVSYVLSASGEIAKQLRRGQLVVLESTTYPGTTDEALLPLLEKTGKHLDTDFLLAFSPERVDPGNREFLIPNIPKIVGGVSADSTRAACALYGRICNRVHPVSSSRVAEAAKLWENTFRSVNIALANEMALLCRQLGIESSEVIDAARTKPFGFMPFYPGPGVGGHCIPLDPHYLSWKAKQHGYHSRFIQVAQEVNGNMPRYIVGLVAEALNEHGKALRGAGVLILGVAYKSDVNDIRESPAVEIMELLLRRGADVKFHDPYVPSVHVDSEELQVAHRTRNGKPVKERSAVFTSVPLDAETVAQADCVLIVTAHRSIDYAMVGANAKLVVDTRSAMPKDSAASVVRL